MDKKPHATGPYNPTVALSNKFETALEKAIINKGYSIVGGEKITWIDGELPVEAIQSGKDDYGRLDLLGIDSAGNYVLCELKFSGDSDGNGDPAEADVQLLGYATSLKEDAKWFRLHKDIPLEHKIDFEKLRSNRLRVMVVANIDYWTTWKSKNKSRQDGQRRKLSQDVEHYAINVDAEGFSKYKQLAIKGRYKPEMEDSAAEWITIANHEYD